MVAEQLEEALNTRVAIEQAKGIIAERLGCTTDQAFTRLRLRAQSDARRLGDIAQDVIDGKLRTDDELP